MKTLTNIFIFSMIAMLFVSCDQSASIEDNRPVDHTTIYQDLIQLEYSILNQDYETAAQHSKNVDKLLKENYNLFCPEESAQIDGARMSNRILAQHLADANRDKLLDDLRILKATIIHLSTDEDYDPYMAFLWRFEEDMYAATGVAIDPMLDLYEWNEFEVFVACMNESWYAVQHHQPSAALLDHDEAQYKNQSLHKIYLEKAIEDFNISVNEAGSEDFPLCESAESLRDAYTQYIKTFIENRLASDSFLA